MKNFDYNRAILLGVVLGMSFLSLFYIMFAPYSSEEVKEPQSITSDHKGTYTVIDTYKGCDVVQWQYGMLAEYQYFLHCNNTRPVYEK